MPDPVNPAVPAEPESLVSDANPEALAKKNRELLGELKKVKERFKVLETAATAAGVDPSDPAGFIARRDAEARAKADREIRVRDAVKDHLLEGGQKVDRKILSVLISGAIGDPSVAIDEKGDLSGVPEYVNGWLTSLNNAAPRRVAPGLPPVTSLRAPNPGDATGPANFTELTNQGPAAVKAYEERNPARFAEMREAHIQALRNPTRTQPPR